MTLFITTPGCNLASSLTPLETECYEGEINICAWLIIVWDIQHRCNQCTSDALECCTMHNCCSPSETCGSNGVTPVFVLQNSIRRLDYFEVPNISAYRWWNCPATNKACKSRSPSNLTVCCSISAGFCFGSLRSS